MSGILQTLIYGVSVVKDAYFNLVTLLLNTTATNGAQNNTFLDSSTNNFTITRNGNTTQGTFTPFSQAAGYWSNYFDGNDDDLSIASNANLTPASSDFTLECWIFPTSWGGSGTFRAIIAGPISGCMFFGQTSTNFGLRALATGDIVVTSTLPTVNTWTHVAVSRSGTTARLFINGALAATATDSTNFPQTQVVIGNTSVNGTEEYYGYISNLRFVKGTAVYTSAFTPSTTPLTAVSNTQLLTCQSNRFVDNSTNAFSINSNGNISVQAFSPFVPTDAYSTSVVGGSGYFDGATDYLTTPSSANLAMGSGDITAECWVYPLISANQQWIFDFRTSGSESTTTLYAYIGDSNGVLYTGFGGFGDQASGTPIANTWNHIAIVRSGSGSNNVAVFLNGVRTKQLTDTTNLSTSTSVYIGRRYVVTVGNQYMAGYISGDRFVKGTAVYSPSSSTLTLPTAPPTAITNTQLLLNYTNAGIYDSAAKNDLETVGNAQVSTTQAKWGTTSMYFDGSGDWLYNAASTLNVGFGTGNFTVEMWVYPTSNPANGPGTVFDARNSATSEGWVIRIFSDLSVGFYDGPNNVYQQTAASAVPLNTWTYLAFVRSGTTLTIYVNGTSAKTATVSSNLGTSWPFYVGNNYSAGYTYYGYIDDLRITKGYARTISSSPSSAFPIQ